MSESNDPNVAVSQPTEKPEVSNVVPFKSKAQLERADDRCSMERTLKDMLELVEKGELVSVACVAVHKQGGVMSNFSNSPQIEMLIGATATLHHKLCNVRENELMSRPLPVS